MGSSLPIVYLPDHSAFIRVLLLGSAGVAVQIYGTQMTPQELFARIFCFGAAVSLGINVRHHVRYYTWQCESQLSTRFRRGLGNQPCGAVYGYAGPLPCLAPSAVRILGLTIAAVFALASVFPWTASAWLILSSFPLSVLYLTQVNSDTNIGNRKGLILLFVAVYVGLAGDSPWGVDMLKVHIASWYFGAGVIKMATSMWKRRFWGDGTTFQDTLAQCMVSRPGKDLLVRTICEVAFRSKLICVGGSLFALVFELVLPLLAFYNEFGSIVFGLCVLAWTYSTNVFVGINFVDYHAIGAGLAFILVPRTSNLFEAAAVHCWEGPFIIAALHLGVQLFCTITFADVWGALRGALPFTCCPMFSQPISIWNDKDPVVYCFAGVNFRDQGECDWLQWATVFCHGGAGIKKPDLRAFPYKVVQFGHRGEGLSHSYAAFFKAKSGPLFHANFPTPETFQDKVLEFCRFLKRHPEKSAWDPLRTTKFITMLDALHAEFAAFPSNINTETPRGVPNFGVLEECERYESVWNGYLITPK